MTNLLEIKDRLIRFYSKYESYLFPVVKFIVAFVLFTTINMNIGFMEKISRFPVALILALVCAILPVNAMIWLAALIVLADMYAHSTDIVGCFIEYGGNFVNHLSADNKPAHLLLGGCQRWYNSRYVGMLHPALIHSMLHSPDKVSFGALVETVEEFGYVLACHTAAP